LRNDALQALGALGPCCIYFSFSKRRKIEKRREEKSNGAKGLKGLKGVDLTSWEQ